MASPCKGAQVGPPLVQPNPFNETERRRLETISGMDFGPERSCDRPSCGAFMDFETFIYKKTTKSLKTEELFDKFILRSACGQHLNILVTNFKLQGAKNLDAMQPHWYSLIDAEVLDRTSQKALSAWKEAQAKGFPHTRYFLEAGPTGRMIVVTCAAWLDERRFLRSVPDRSYLVFIL